MHLIFYTFLDVSNQVYLELNDSLVRITKEYPLYFLNSGVDSERICQRGYEKANVIHCSNNMQLKFNKLMGELKDVDYDILVKIDLDSIIFDYDRLIQMVLETKPNQFRGVLRTVKGITYTRGGCNACHRSTIANFRFNLSGNCMDVDIPMGEQLECERIDIPLFEINDNYTGTAPVWHPEKINKLKLFKEHLTKRTAIRIVE